MSKFLKSFVLVFLFLVVLVLSLILFVFQKISLSLDKSPNYVLETLLSINKDNQYIGKENLNFVVLGLDKRDDLLEKTSVTDTIMFISLNLKTQRINTISIPRDLWFYDINSKVNEIYPLSQSEPNQLQFIKDKFQQLTGQPINHIVVFTTENLIKFVNLIGGVDLVLDNGFIDTQYPNPEYIKNPDTNVSKYKTVEFKSGLIHLDASNITEFVRSRKGGETVSTGGTDLARTKRQQLLVEAILNKVKTGQFVDKNLNLPKLYNFWDKEIIKDILDKDILNILTIVGENISKLTLNKIDIPIGTNSKNGVIYHPNRFINKQWVFIPSDKDYKSFQQFISNSL